MQIFRVTFLTTVSDETIYLSYFSKQLFWNFRQSKFHYCFPRSDSFITNTFNAKEMELYYTISLKKDIALDISVFPPIIFLSRKSMIFEIGKP